MDHFNLTTNATTMPVSFNGSNSIIVNGTEYIRSSVYWDLDDLKREVFYLHLIIIFLMMLGIMIFAHAACSRDRIIERIRQKEELRLLKLHARNDGPKKDLRYGAIAL